METESRLHCIGIIAQTPYCMSCKTFCSLYLFCKRNILLIYILLWNNFNYNLTAIKYLFALYLVLNNVTKIMEKDIFNYSPTVKFLGNPVSIAGQTPSLKKWKLDYYAGMSFFLFSFSFFVFLVTGIFFLMLNNFYLFISWSIVGFAFQLLPVLTKLHDTGCPKKYGNSVTNLTKP